MDHSRPHSPSPSNNGQSLYEECLQSGVPLFETRLVRQSAVPFETREQVSSPDEVVDVLKGYYSLRDREEVLLVLLDASNSVIGITVVSVGGLTESVIDPRQIFKTAILANAASIILCHNHPSGNCEASPADVQVTRKIAQAGRVLDIHLRDHLIIAGDAFTSLASKGLVSDDKS